MDQEIMCSSLSLFMILHHWTPCCSSRVFFPKSMCLLLHLFSFPLQKIPYNLWNAHLLFENCAQCTDHSLLFLHTKSKQWMKLCMTKLSTQIASPGDQRLYFSSEFGDKKPEAVYMVQQETHRRCAGLRRCLHLHSLFPPFKELVDLFSNKHLPIKW